MPAPITRPGGYLNTDTGEKILASDLDRVGGMALQSLWDGWLALLLRDGAGDPTTGFAGTDCAVILSVVPLTVQVAAGIGFYYDTATADEFGPVYRPIVVGAAVATDLAAHDPADPRIDIVCLAPAYADDQPESRSVKDPATSVVSTQTVQKRKRANYTLQVVTGTPAASPAAPATPAGYVKIAECDVPAAVGNAVIRDRRPLVQPGTDWVADPSAEYATNFVPGSGNELKVSQTTVASASVLVQLGAAVVQGRRRKYVQQSVVVTANATGVTRYDAVVANSAGAIVVTVGGASSGSAVIAAGDCQLAEIAAPNAFVTIVDANITDSRVRRPVGNAQIRALSVGTAEIQTAAVTSPKLDATTIQYAEVTVSSAQLLAIRATPIVMVAAPGAGKFVEFLSAVLLLDFNAAAYVITAGADDLAFKYINGAGVTASTAIDTAGFLDQVADRAVHSRPNAAPPPWTAAQIVNQALVLHNVGANEFTVGDSPVRVKIAYRVHATGW